MDDKLIAYFKEYKELNYSWREIAEAFKVPESTLKSNVGCAKKPKIPICETERFKDYPALLAGKSTSTKGIKEYLTTKQLEYLADYRDIDSVSINYIHHSVVLNLLRLLPIDKRHLLEGITKYTMEESSVKVRDIRTSIRASYEAEYNSKLSKALDSLQ
jgi:predicted DNA-binding protein YlxM (UPF0122 family)